MESSSQKNPRLYGLFRGVRIRNGSPASTRQTMSRTTNRIPFVSNMFWCSYSVSVHKRMNGSLGDVG
uniref:Uncharacterized protein n=1 Tax=Anguilla anguilla TaxID=7936 RepID=A0A0E9WIX9_ANGAN